MSKQVMKCKALYLICEPEPIRDCYISVCEGFVIVGLSEEDAAPTWYSPASIDHMEGVTAAPRQAPSKAVFF